MGSSWTRDGTRLPCTGRQIINCWVRPLGPFWVHSNLRTNDSKCRLLIMAESMACKRQVMSLAVFYHTGDREMWFMEGSQRWSNTSIPGGWGLLNHLLSPLPWFLKLGQSPISGSSQSWILLTDTLWKAPLCYFQSICERYRSRIIIIIRKVGRRGQQECKKLCRKQNRGLSGDTVVKNLRFHCRGRGFDPWLRN